MNTINASRINASRITAKPTVVRASPRRRDPVAARRPARRRSEATYRRRRAVVGLVLAVLVAVAVVVVHDVVFSPGSEPAFAAAPAQRSVAVRVTVRPGDTLWSIGQEHRGSVPIRRYVDALVELNGGPSIRAGQSVLLP